MTPPREVWVSVHRKRKNEVGLAYTAAEREAIGDVSAAEWERVRYILPQSLLTAEGRTRLELALNYDGPRDFRYVSGLMDALARVIEPHDHAYTVRYEDLCRYLLAADARIRGDA